MNHGPAHAGVPTPFPRTLFDDPVAERARSFIEPVLKRAEDAEKVGAEAERWVNLVYLAFKLLQTRPHVGRRSRSMIAWPVQRRTVRDLIAASPRSEERTLLLALLEALDEDGAQQPPTRAWIAARTEYAEWLEAQGHVASALALFAVTDGDAWGQAAAIDTVRGTLLVARLYRRLARWEAAERGYSAAGRMALQIGAEELGFHAEIGSALALTQRGNLPEAHRRWLDLHARTQHASADLRYRVASNFGLLLERIGKPVDALARFLEAAALAPDSQSILLVFSNIGVVLAQLGYWSAALAVQEMVRARASSWTIRVNAEIETLASLSRRDPDEFRRRASELESMIARMSPAMRVDCRYQIAAGAALLGDRQRASELLTDALSDAAANGLHQWYFRIESNCADLLGAAPPTSWEDPEPTAPLERLLAGVRAFAASVAGDDLEPQLSRCSSPASHSS